VDEAGTTEKKMKNRLTIVSVFAVLVCFVGASAVAQSPEDPEALRRDLAAERARLVGATLRMSAWR